MKNTKYKYMLIDRYKGTSETIETKERLIERLARANVRMTIEELFNALINVKYSNKILDNMDFSGHDLDINGEPKRYLLLDGYGRVINARMYIDDIDKYNSEHRKKCRYNTYLEDKYNKANCRFREDPVPGTGVRHWGYFRRPRLMRSYRQAHIKEYEPYVRKRATLDKADMWWDEFPKDLCKSWKHQGKRKRQWDKSNRYKKGEYIIKEVPKRQEVKKDEWEDYTWEF